MLFPYTWICTILVLLYCFSHFDIRLPHADSPWGAFPVWAKLGDSAGQLLRRPPKRIQLHFIFFLSLSSLLLLLCLDRPLRGFPLPFSIPS